MRQGQLKAATALATVPVGLVWVHYLTKPWFGQFGLLGLGTLAWFLAVVSLLIPIGSYTPPYLHGRRDITFYHATRHKELLQGGYNRNMNG